MSTLRTSATGATGATGPARLGLLVSLASLGGLALLNCATTDNDAVGKDAATSVVPEAAAPGDGDSGDAGVDADTSCEAGASNCTTEEVSCDEVDWCLVPTGVSPLFAMTSIWGTSKNDLWIGGSGGTMVHYDGTTWTPTPTNVHNTFNAIWGSSASDLYAVSSSALVLHSTGFQDGTATWTPVSFPIEQGIGSRFGTVWGTSADDVRMGGVSFTVVQDGMFLGSGNQFVRSAEGGEAKWSPVLGYATILSIWGASPNDFWISADASGYWETPWALGQTLHATRGDDGTLSFADIDSLSAGRLSSVHGSSTNDVWAVGDQGAIRHITAQDSRWQIVTSPTIADLQAVWAVAPNDVWAVGEDGTILHFDGTKVTPSSAQLPLGRKPMLRGIWGSSANDIWIVGGNAALHYTGPKTKKAGR